jgi:integrase
MRPGELFALDWENVDVAAGENGLVRVMQRLYRGRHAFPKSNKERTITLPTAAEAGARLAARDPGLLPRRVRDPQQDRPATAARKANRTSSECVRGRLL